MTYRVYFNRSEDPQKWSVDEGTSATEITVMGFSLQGVTAVGATCDEGPQPHAWVVVTCSRMSIQNGIAYFE